MLSSDLRRVMLICTLRADLECQGQLDLAERGNIRQYKAYLDGFPVWVSQDTSHRLEGCIPGCRQLQDHMALLGDLPHTTRGDNVLRQCPVKPRIQFLNDTIYRPLQFVYNILELRSLYKERPHQGYRKTTVCASASKALCLISRSTESVPQRFHAVIASSSSDSIPKKPGISSRSSRRT